MFRVEPTYVAGEETAAVRALNGGPAKPSDKPPRPFEWRDWPPTLVSNVETLANLPFLARRGPEAFRACGTDRSPGTFLSPGGAVASPGLYEVPLGASLRGVVDELGEGSGAISGVLMAGYFAGLVGARAEQVTLDYDSLREMAAAWAVGRCRSSGPSTVRWRWRRT